MEKQLSQTIQYLVRGTKSNLSSQLAKDKQNVLIMLQPYGITGQ